MNHVDKQIKDLELYVALEISRIKNWKEGDAAVNWLDIRSGFQRQVIQILSGKAIPESGEAKWGITNRHTLPNQMQVFKVFQVFDLFITEVESAYQPVNAEDGDMNPLPTDNPAGNIPTIDKYNGKKFQEVVLPAQYRRLSKNDLVLINAMGNKVRDSENVKIFLLILLVIALIGGTVLFIRHLKAKNERAMALESSSMYPDNLDIIDDEDYDEYPEVEDDYGDVPEPTTTVSDKAATAATVVKTLAKAVKVTTTPAVAIVDNLA